MVFSSISFLFFFLPLLFFCYFLVPKRAKNYVLLLFSFIFYYNKEKEYVLEGKNNGGTFATSCIKQCFNEIYSENKPKDFAIPESVTEIEIDSKLYDEENIIKVASENCPERYRLKILVAKRFEPKEVSDLFDNISVKNFDVKVNKLNAEISFDAVDYLKYELYKVNNNKPTKLINYSNKSGKITYNDTNLNYGSKYGYYLKQTIHDDYVSRLF